MSRSETRRKAFRDSVLEVASGLDQKNILEVLFLQKNKIKQQCTCSSPNGAEHITCPHHSGSKGILIMDQLLERGVFSEEDTGPLLDMLYRIGRVDLANKFNESYVQKYLAESDPFRPRPDLSPTQRPAAIHYPPSQLITLGQVPQHDIENDFAAQNTPLTPSHVPYGTPTHTPSPCNTPTHLTRKFGTSSPISKPLKDNYTTENHDLGQDSDSPTATTPPDTCFMCGQQCTTNAPEANSVLLSVTSTKSLPVNAFSLRNQIERDCQSEQGQYAEAETRHLDELENGSLVDVSPSASPSDSLSQEFVVVLNKRELKTVNQAIERNTSIPDEISQKFKNPKPKQEQDDLADGYDLIDPDEFPRMCCHCQCQNQRPSRAFSFDSIKKLTPKRNKKFFPHQSSVPEVSQSCSNIPDCNSAALVGSRLCACDGACNHSPVPVEPSRETRRGWLGSKDSGMGSSQEGANPPENLKESESSGKASPLSPRSKPSTCEDGIGLCEWKIERSKCHTAIYNHKNTSFDKKVNTYIGKGKAKRSVNLLVKLYPNGLDMDRGSNATMTVDVVGMSHPNLNYDLDCTFRGVDAQDESLLVSRKTEFPLSNKKLTVNNFLSHDVIKQSSAKYFKFYLKFELKVVIDREWVVVQ